MDPAEIVRQHLKWRTSDEPIAPPVPSKQVDDALAMVLAELHLLRKYHNENVALVTRNNQS